MPLSVESGPGVSPGQASDAPVSPFRRGFGLPSLRNSAPPGDERPSWLPEVPHNPERYPQPQQWYRDSIAAL
jgi:hypothetical protein